MAPSLIARGLAHHRAALAVAVVGLPLACWIWVVAMARDMYGSMAGTSAWMMRPTWDAPFILLLWAMWAAMMAGMMLPSATPVILLAARPVAAASNRHATTRLYGLVAGYLLVWSLFSVGATALQFALSRTGILTMMLEPASRTVGAALIFVAGLYQLTPLKHACLRSCRSPISMLGSGLGHGVTGAVSAGWRHGVFCLGCCWAMMLLLFAGGVMNLVVILTLTVWVAVEKLAPHAEKSTRITGALLIVAAVWIWLR